MQAIRTRFYGPGNVKGARIIARCEAGSISIGYDYSIDVEGNHRAACEALRKRLKWEGPTYPPMVGGVYEGDFYWVFTS